MLVAGDAHPVPGCPIGAGGDGSSRLRGFDRAAYPSRRRWRDLSVGRTHFVDEGQGVGFLFVHGTPAWWFEWRQIIRGPSPDRRCIAPDLIGFGLSDRRREFPYTREAHTAGLAEFVDRLGVGPFTLMVHDGGGPIALPLGLKAPDRVTRLVLPNT